MADKYLQITNFKYGLSTLREELTSQVGTLIQLVNGVVTPGGEIYKRKAFVLDGNLGILDGSGDTGTFGLQDTDTGRMTFGSALANGTTPTQSQPVLVSAMPTGYVYQQLKHPFLSDSASNSYDRTKHRMTAVIWSLNYNGKAFVCAKFIDFALTGSYYLYYDGTLVAQSRNGLILDGDTGASDASSLAAQLNAIGWTGSATAETCDVKSPNGTQFSIAQSENDPSRAILLKHVDGEYAGVDGLSAIASFQITAITSPNNFTLTYDPSGANIVLFTAATAVNTSDPATAARTISQLINQYTSSPEFTATVVDATVTVFGPVAYTTANGKTLRIAWSGTATITGSPPVTAVATPLAHTRQVTVSSNTGWVYYFGGYFTAYPSGGTAPYTFVWEITAIEPAVKNWILVTTSASGNTARAKCNGFVLADAGKSFTVRFRCKITDSVNAVQYTNEVSETFKCVKF